MRELNQGLDPNIPSQKVVIDLNNKNERIYGPYHSECGLFQQFCKCGAEPPHYAKAKNQKKYSLDRGKINTIISEIRGLILETNPSDEDSFLNYIGNMLCQFDTDVAIEVMNDLGDEGKREALRIKVVYGY
jgi:hypothetical protein